MSSDTTTRRKEALDALKRMHEEFEAELLRAAKEAQPLFLKTFAETARRMEEAQTKKDSLRVKREKNEQRAIPNDGRIV